MKKLQDILYGVSIESIIGSTYATSYKWSDDKTIIPTITGKAFVTSQATLMYDPLDPYKHGIVP